jgi:small subunit ribosomal protein S1
LTNESNPDEPRTTGGPEEETPVVDAADPVAADSTETAEEPEPAMASVQPDAADDTSDVVSEETAPAPAAEPEPAAAESVTEADATPTEPERVAAAAIAVEPEPEADAVAPVAVEAEADAQQPADASADADTAETTVRAQEAATVEAAEPEAVAAQEPTNESMTMAELLDHPDNEVKSLKHGDVVEGKVVRIDPDEILVDFGGKSEGVVSNRELMNRRGPRDGGDESRPELSVDDEVLVYVLQPESPEGHAVLSLRRAGLERKWRAMQERFDAGEIVEARVIDHNKGGLIVDLGVRGFVPISQIVDFPRRPRDEQPRDAAQEIAEKLQPFVGRTLRLKILEVNRKANRLILSEKVALYEERREKRDELFSSLETGQRVTGVVRSIAPFGVFVDLGGIDGLVHKSELSWNKVNNPETAHQIGDEVEAEVIDINHERGRISLSIRRLQPDPWQESVAKYKIGDVIDGAVTKLVNFGAFVRVEEGLEGLIHISELSHQRVAHPGDVVQEGQEVKLRIISLDSERHRLGLSLKQAEDRPAPAPREERPRRDRPQRRDRFEYRPEDATAEPEGGIDNTMAAAFASSGLLEQFRTSQGGEERTAADQPATPEPTATEDEAAPVEEPIAAEEIPAIEEPATPEEAAPVEEPIAAEADSSTDADAAAEPEVSEEPAAAEAAEELSEPEPEKAKA